MTNKRPDKEFQTHIDEEEEMSWEEIERQVATETDEAIKFQKEIIVPGRSTNWDRYYGRPFGNEIPGRSQYMSRDLLETIEWILPNLIKLFTGTDFKVKMRVYSEEAQGMGISPEDLGLALMKQIYKDLYSDESMGLFMVFYTWFKDALVSGSAFTKLFWEVDTTLAEFDEVMDQFEFDELSTVPEVTIAQTELLPTGQLKTKGTIERISKDDLVCDNIPHYEFIFEEHTRSMNDDTGKGFTTVVTMDYLKRINEAFSEDEDKFFYDLEKVTAISSNNWHDYQTDDEKKRFYDYETLNEYVGKDRKGPKRRVQLTEWYTRMDVNGDGFLEDIKVWRANGVMIRWEYNEANFIPCSKLSPILDPYHFQGLAYADLIIELQELKTMLMRKTLDNYDYQNSGRWFVKPNTPLDMDRFLENIPGDVHRVNPDHIKNMAPVGFDSSSLSLIEYVEGIKENRTGSTRYNQGTSADTLNQTAHGIQTIMSASMKRIELIGQLFAEGGIKDFFKKAAMLYQKNMQEPFQQKIDGTMIEIAPEMLEVAEIECYVDMGVEDTAGQAESQKLLQMSAVLQDLNSKNPGLMPPEKVRALSAKYISAMGFEADDYIASTEEFKQSTDQALAQGQQMQQLQIMMEKLKLQIEKEGVDIKKLTAIGEIVQAQEELKAKLVIEQAKLKTKEGETFRSQNVDLFKEIYSHVGQVHTSPKQLNEVA